MPLWLVLVVIYLGLILGWLVLDWLNPCTGRIVDPFACLVRGLS